MVGSPTPPPDMGSGYVPPPSCLVVVTGDLFKLFHLRTYPLNGGHRNTYGWQADGMHTTEMLSCATNFQV